MIKARFGSDFDRVVHTILPFVRRIPFKPDTLTLMGGVVSIGAGVAFAQDAPVWGGVILLLSGIFDLVDGVVARVQGTSSEAGAFLDSSMDRVADLAVFGGIAVGYAAQANTWGAALVIWALSASVMTSYARARAEKKLANFKVGLMERGERVVALILGAWTGYLELALLVIAVGATITTVQRLVIARRLLRVMEETGQDPTCEEVSHHAEGTGRPDGLSDARNVG